jgi:hypothetical protein
MVVFELLYIFTVWIKTVYLSKRYSDRLQFKKMMMEIFDVNLTAAVGKSHGCCWKISRLLLENLTAVVGKSHGCCWKISRLLLENLKAIVE